jgi:Fur family ferric uptake transcriptional regulator
VSSRATHRQALKDYLQDKCLKWTSQREAIFEVFLATEGHLTGEEIYRRVCGEHPHVGFSTVYRSLRLFVDAGVASERNFRDGVTRYEVRQPHHDHLVCLGCGRIVEFENEAIEAQQEQVAATHGFRLTSHRHELYGHCQDCQE